MNRFAAKLTICIAFSLGITYLLSGFDFWRMDAAERRQLVNSSNRIKFSASLMSSDMSSPAKPFLRKEE